jgi:hypothetical protein
MADPVRGHTGNARSRPSRQGRTISPDSLFASDERIDAYVLIGIRDPRVGVRPEKNAEIVSLRSFIDDGGARLKQLLAQPRAQAWKPFVTRPIGVG